MSWICPKCNRENTDFIIQDLRKTKCLCGYDLLSKEADTKKRIEGLSKIDSGIENRIEEQAHGIGWKIYFGFFVLTRILELYFSFFEEVNYIYINILFGSLHLVLSSTVLYSWIWARRIRLLSHIRWLVKLWSIQFFIAPIALVVHGYFALIMSNPESIDWVITIIIQYPALYAVYRIAWKSRLLYRK